MAPAWAKMMTGIYETRFKLVNEARNKDNQLKADPFNPGHTLIKTEKGIYVADELVPCSETL